MNNYQTWSLIIFAYNEETSVQEVVEKALAVLKKLTPLQSELIIVNDGSTDGTLKVIENIRKSNPGIVLISHTKNQGIGHALISGYKACHFENICAIPADGQFDTEELLPYTIVPEKTIISFYRNKKYNYTFFRELLSKTNAFLNRYFLGINLRDVNWIKIYKKEFFNNNPLILTSSLVESEICAKMLRYKYKLIEVPSIYHLRTGGKSKGASAKTIFKALIEVFKLYKVLNR